MFRVFVTGGSGFVGSAFTAKAAADPRVAVQALRHLDDIPRLRVSDAIVGDVADVGSYAEAMLSADHIIWFAAERSHFADRAVLDRVNVEPIRAAAARLAATARPPHFTYISTISVLDTPEPRSAPLRNRPTGDGPLTPYGRSKKDAEDIVRSMLPCHTILRLPFMYGQGARSGAHGSMWRLIARSRARRFFQFDGHLALLHTSDLADLLMAFVTGEVSWPMRETFLPTDGSIYPLETIIEAAERVLNHDATRTMTRRLAARGPVRAGVRLFGSTELRYWSRMLTEDWCFAAEADEPPLPPGFRYTGLEQGLSDYLVDKQETHGE